MALDKLTLIDESVISTTVTAAVNNLAQTNYIAYPIAIGNPLSNGWRVYKDSDAIAPTVGTGGSPNTTLTQNTSSPLNSTGDFRITKTSGASRRGEGISTDFTIASRHLAKVLQISFDYEVVTGSTLATDDLRVYIIANPSTTINPGVTNIVIEPVNVSIQGVLTGTRVRHLATFQTDFTITTYRLCIHIATSTNSNQNIDFNNFRVWEHTQSIGAIITDWQSYTPTILGGGTLTNVSVRWRRVGGSLEIQGKLTLGTVSNYEFQLSLPNGLTVSPIVNTINQRVGQLNYTRPIDNYGVQFVLLASSGHSYLGHSAYYQIALDGRSGSDQHTRRSTDYILETGGTISFQAEVPIAGWGSSVAMSSDTGDSRVVACTYTGFTASGSTLVYGSISRQFDTHNAYNTTTGVFTAPVSGYYKGTFVGASNSASYFRFGGVGAGYSPSGVYGTFSVTIFLNAGQTASFTASSGTPIADSSVSMSIERISAGTQQIAATETVSLGYAKLTYETLSPGSSYSFPIIGGRLHDTHNAWNGTTFTAPMSGFYSINLIVGVNSTNSYFEIWRNGGFFARYLKSGVMTLNVSATLRLVAGNTIQFRPIDNSQTLTGSNPNNGDTSFIYINRIGI